MAAEDYIINKPKIKHTMQKYWYGGTTDIGTSREIMEDFVHAVELDDKTLFVAVADGMGSKTSGLNSACVAVSEIEYSIKRIFENNYDLFCDETELFLKEAFYNANRVLGAFKLSNIEQYSGFGCSLTCAVFKDSGEMSYAHCGNTRLHLIREDKNGNFAVKQLTADHTLGYQMLKEGIMTIDEYYWSQERLQLTSALGELTNPIIDTITVDLKKNDFIVITTDGIHYTLSSVSIGDLVLMSGKCDDAADALIKAAKETKYPDNASAMVVYSNI